MPRGAAINRILGVLIALLPFYFRISPLFVYQGRNVAEIDDTVVKETLLFWALILLMAFMPEAHRKVQNWFFYLGAYFLGSVVINEYHPFAYDTFVQGSWMILGLCFVKKLAESFDRASERFILDGMFYGCLIQSIACILDRFHLSYSTLLHAIYSDIPKDLWAQTVHESLGTLGLPDFAASYLVLSSASMLNKKRWPFLFLVAIALYLVGASMGAFAFSGMLLYFAFTQRTKWFAFPYPATALVFVIGMLTGIVGMLQNGRFVAWEAMLAHFPLFDLKALIFGKGPGWFIYTFPQSFASIHGVWGQEHNEFLYALFAYGLLGLGAFLFAIIKIAQGRAPGPWKAILFGAFVLSFGHFVFHQASAAVLIIVALGVCLHYDSKNNYSLEVLQ